MDTTGNERKRLRRQRQRLRASYGELYDQVLGILYRHDPIAITVKMEEDNYDEYAPEVDMILPRLKESGSAEDLSRIVYAVFVQMFSPRSAGSEADYRPIAQEIWERWRVFAEHAPRSSRAAS